MRSIEWTDVTWNPVRGCSKVSAGCKHCYAERQAARFSGPGKPYDGLVFRPGDGRRTGWTGEARFIPEMLAAPLKWRKPCRVFVNSMSDLFHDDISNEQIAAIFGVMAACPQHTFQVLTKRAARMPEWFEWLESHPHWSHPLQEALCEHPGPLPGLEADDEGVTLAREVGHRDWPLPNVHLGVSIENQSAADERVPCLLATPAAVRWVSCEPLLEVIDLALSAFNGADSFGQMEGLHWVVIGCESGPGRRRCDTTWISCMVEQCRDAGVPVFVKQVDLGGKVSKDPTEWPEGLRVRMFPGEKWSA